jgi:hypothetical protein
VLPAAPLRPEMLGAGGRGAERGCVRARRARRPAGPARLLRGVALRNDLGDLRGRRAAGETKGQEGAAPASALVAGGRRSAPGGGGRARAAGAREGGQRRPANARSAGAPPRAGARRGGAFASARQPRACCCARWKTPERQASSSRWIASAGTSPDTSSTACLRAGFFWCVEGLGCVGV